MAATDSPSRDPSFRGPECDSQGSSVRCRADSLAAPDAGWRQQRNRPAATCRASERVGGNTSNEGMGIRPGESRPTRRLVWDVNARDLVGRDAPLFGRVAENVVRLQVLDRMMSALTLRSLTFAEHATDDNLTFDGVRREQSDHRARSSRRVGRAHEPHCWCGNAWCPQTAKGQAGTRACRPSGAQAPARLCHD